MTELVIDPARLSFIDIVTSTHNHTDHLDAETLSPILAANSSVKLVIADANRAFVADRLKIDAGIAIGLTTEPLSKYRNQIFRRRNRRTKRWSAMSAAVRSS